MSRFCVEAKILMLNFQKSLAENAASKLTESTFPVSETAENLIFHFQKLRVKSASQKLKTTPFVCNAVEEVVNISLVFYLCFIPFFFVHACYFLFYVFWALLLGRFRVLCCSIIFETGAYANPIALISLYLLFLIFNFFLV